MAVYIKKSKPQMSANGIDLFPTKLVCFVDKTLHISITETDKDNKRKI